MTEKDQEILYKSIGNQIKDLRKRMRLSQEELAEQLGLSRASVVNIEKGRQHPSVHMLVDIAKIFKVPVTDFLSDQLLDASFHTERITRIKREIPKYTKGDSVEKVSEFLEAISKNN
jgi:transcriptional regulator with XRE-family HTH domain